MYGIIYGHLILLTNVPSGGQRIVVQNLHYNEVNAMTASFIEYLKKVLNKLKVHVIKNANFRILAINGRHNPN